MADKDFEKFCEEVLAIKIGGESLFEYSWSNYPSDDESEGQAQDPDCVSWHNGCIELKFNFLTTKSLVIHRFTIDNPAFWGGSNYEEPFVWKNDYYSVDLPEVSLCHHFGSDEASIRMFQLALFASKCLSEGDFLDGIFGCLSERYPPDTCMGINVEAAKTLAIFVRRVFDNFLKNECSCGALAKMQISEFSDLYK